ncbi:MAG: hypothetical protein NUW37_12900 [Planctomycetes bacterium]|nr:hypothetical protein [Planctomycetota bacterium]
MALTEQQRPGNGERRRIDLLGAFVVFAAAMLCFIGPRAGLFEFFVPPHAFALALTIAGLYLTILLPVIWWDRARKSGERGLPSLRIELCFSVLLLAAFPFSSVAVAVLAMSLLLLFAVGGFVRLLLRPAKRFPWIALVLSGVSIAVPSIIFFGEIVASAGKSNFAPMQFQYPLKVAWSWRSASLPVWLFRVGSGDVADVFSSGVNSEYEKPPRIREVDHEGGAKIAFAEADVFGAESSRAGRSITIRFSAPGPHSYLVKSGEDFTIELDFSEDGAWTEESMVRWLCVAKPEVGGLHQSILDKDGEILLSKRIELPAYRSGRFDVLVVYDSDVPKVFNESDGAIRFTKLPASEKPARTNLLAGFSAIVDTRAAFRVDEYLPYLSAGGKLVCALPRGPDDPKVPEILFLPDFSDPGIIETIRESLAQVQDVEPEFDSLLFYPPMTRSGLGSQYGGLGTAVMALVFAGLVGFHFLGLSKLGRFSVLFLVILPIAASLVLRLALSFGMDGNIERFDVLIPAEAGGGVYRVSAARFEPTGAHGRITFADDPRTLVQPLFVSTPIPVDPEHPELRDPNLRHAGFTARGFASAKGPATWNFELRLRDERAFFIEYAFEPRAAPELTATETADGFKVTFVASALDKVGGAVVFLGGNSVIPVGRLKSGETKEVKLGSAMSFESYGPRIDREFASDAFSFSGALRFFRSSVSFRAKRWVLGFVVDRPRTQEDRYNQALRHPYLLATPIAE